MVSEGVSEVLFKSIQELTSLNELGDFSLGGGTNLAIKYNHRESTDIDLFFPRYSGNRIDEEN